MTRPNGSRDSGQSLMELLVAMSLASIVLASMAAVVVGQVRATSQVTAKVSSTADARLAAGTMARRLRVAVEPQSTVPAFETATPSSVTFYASLATTGGSTDPRPTKVTYTTVPTTFNGRATSCLQESTVAATGTAPPYAYTSAPVTSCLAHGDVNPAGGALFTYHSDPVGAATTADLSSIRSVGVSLELRGASGGTAATTRTTSRVTLPNIRPIEGS